MSSAAEDAAAGSDVDADASTVTSTSVMPRTGTAPAAATANEPLRFMGLLHNSARTHRTAARQAADLPAVLAGQARRLAAAAWERTVGRPAVAWSRLSASKRGEAA